MVGRVIQFTARTANDSLRSSVVRSRCRMNKFLVVARRFGWKQSLTILEDVARRNLAGLDSFEPSATINSTTTAKRLNREPARGIGA